MEQSNKQKTTTILRWVYYITTGITCFWMAGGAAGAWFGIEEMSKTIAALGYPDYFHYILAIGKTIGAVLLLVRIPDWLKSMAYGGIMIELVSAFISYNVSGQGLANAMPPLVFLLVVLASFYSYRLNYSHKNQSA